MRRAGTALSFDVDPTAEGGHHNMDHSISNTAEYGQYVPGFAHPALRRRHA
jgi:ketol-acid reductoisomerase